MTDSGDAAAVARLPQLLDQVERRAKAATPGPWHAVSDDENGGYVYANPQFVGHALFQGTGEDAPFIASVSPSFVAAQVAADRALLALHERDQAGCIECLASWPCATVVLRAHAWGAGDRDPLDQR